MLKIVDSFVSVGATPLVDTYYEAARYLRGEGVDFGKQRGVTTLEGEKRYYRISHEDSYTGGTVTGAPNCEEDDPDSANCLNERISGNPIYTSPISHSCQANHIVLLSDGEPNGNIAHDRIKQMVGMDPSASCAASGNAACATELATFLYENDQSDDFAQPQTVTTHTIAFNLSGSGKNFLKSIADAGGGGAYEASSAAELAGVLDSIIKEVADVNTRLHRTCRQP